MCGWCSVHNFLRSLCVFHVCPCHGSDIMGVMHFFFPLWLIPCTLPLVLHRVEFLSVVLIACLSVRLLYFFTFHFNHFHTANYSVRICSVHRNSLEMQFCTPIPWQVVTLFIIKAKRAHIKRNVLLIQCNFFQLVFHSVHIVDAASSPIFYYTTPRQSGSQLIQEFAWHHGREDRKRVKKKIIIIMSVC